MKKLIAVFGALMIVYVLITSLTNVPAPYEAPAAASEAQVYVVRSEDDRVVVYYGDRLYRRTDTPVSSLPKSDRSRLNEGITLTDERELKRLLEDICS